MAAGLADWIGTSRCVDARLDPWPAAALQAALGLDGPTPAAGDPLPPLWSWLYFLDAVPQGELGEDGHPRKGGFLPPVDLPRRMWAGSRLEFLAPLTLGESYTRTSAVADINEKSGRTGRLCFVTVNHEIAGAAGVAVRERQTVVYREPPAANAPAPRAEAAPASASWSTAASADPRLLFRYSALTFNAHRIHYDETYARTVEGYTGLVVHGPLQATLMLQLAREHSGREVLGFEFQGKQPLFAGEAFEVCGEPDGDEVALWVQRDGAITASGSARLG